MTAYYNEIEPHAADWLENLIKMGEIAPGIVDRRSIEDVRPDELVSYTQCHFFAGIGVWSSALRLAGWEDTRPVWTGSCPCQPFSAAGKGGGIVDERHLWPAWDWLIEHGKPPQVPVLGEQVASSDGLAWLDIVSSDLEGKGYACWPYDLCAAGFGSPNIRQRLFFAGIPGAAVAQGDRGESGLEGHSRNGDHRYQSGRIGANTDGPIAEAGTVGGVAESDNPERRTESPGRNHGVRTDAVREESTGHPQGCGGLSGLALASCEQRDRCGQSGAGRRFEDSNRRAISHESGRPGPLNGLWRNADWLYCRDGTWRPVEPGTFPLVDGAAFKLGSGSAHEGKSRAGMLKGYGNAINAEVAAGFIRQVMAELEI